MHDDFATEPVPGLPGHLPPGEVVLWQGRPDAWRLAREAFALDWFAAYWVALVLWRAGVAWSEGGAAQAVAVGLPYAGLGILGAGVIWVLARAQARATLYTITSQRVAMRIGAALTLTLNLPFPQIEGAALDLRRGGTGTIALRLVPGARIAALTLWPHMRPWRLGRPEPALRCIPDAARVAGILAEVAETRLARPVVTRSPAAAHPAAAVPAE